MPGSPHQPVPQRGTPTTPQELVRWVPAGYELPLIADVEVRTFSGSAWDNVRVCRKVTRGPFVMPRGHVASDLVAIVLSSPDRESGRFGPALVCDRGGPGSVNLLPAGMPYTYECSGTREIVHVSVTGGPSDRADRERTVELRPVFASADPLVAQLAMALLHDAATGCAGGRLYGEALGTALEAHLARAYAVDAASVSRTARSLADAQLRRVLDFIDGNLTEDVGVADLARVAGMSRSRLVEEFRRATGQSPYRYLTGRRLERARALLGRREIPISEVAARCGYADQTSFTRVFRRAMQMTPGAYRRAIS